MVSCSEAALSTASAAPVGSQCAIICIHRQLSMQGPLCADLKDVNPDLSLSGSDLVQRPRDQVAG